MGKLLQLRRLNDTDFASYVPQDGEIVLQRCNLHAKTKIGGILTEIDLVQLQTSCMITLIEENSSSVAYVDACAFNIVTGTVANSLLLEGRSCSYYTGYTNMEINKFKTGTYRVYCSAFAENVCTLQGKTYQDILIDIDRCNTSTKNYIDVCVNAV